MTATETVDDMPVEKIVPNPEYKTWLLKDHQVLSALLVSLESKVLSQVRLTSVVEVWAAFTHMFASQSKAWIILVWMQLSNTHKNDPSAIEYFNRMKSLTDQMASTGHPLNNDDLIGYIMSSLDAEYNPLVSYVTTRADSIDLSEFYAYFLTFETCLEQQKQALQIGSIANLAS